MGSVTSQQIWDHFLAVSAGHYHTGAVRSDGQLVCFGLNIDGQCDVPADWDQFWQSQRATTIPVQCVRWSARVLWTPSTSQQIWDQFWRSQRADTILVQCGQMVSSSALDTVVMVSVTSQQIWDQFWQSQRPIPYVCSAVRWSARLLWTQW